MAKLTITMFLFFGLLSCGLPSAPAALFRIEMVSSDEAPASASGKEDPRWETFTLVGVSMLKADGSETYTLYDGADAKSAKIVNRPQLIYQKNMDAMTGMDMSAVSLTFDTAFKAGTDKRGELDGTLSSGVVTLEKDFTFKEGQTRTLNVRVNWGNTVADTTLQEPTIVLDFP